MQMGGLVAQLHGDQRSPKQYQHPVFSTYDTVQQSLLLKNGEYPVTLNNASDYRAIGLSGNGLLD